MLAGVDDKELFRNAERRRDVRIGAKVAVKFQAQAEAAKALSAFSINFSTGGLCLRTRVPHVVGERLQLTITIDADVLQLVGVVAWVKADVIGIRFVEVGPKDRDRLEALSKLLSKTNPTSR
jgi:c-di-GMP-binding flagellar brake protein YcgR